MTKRILIASAAFFPENSPRSFRATELAIELARRGNYVRVVTLERGKVTAEFCREHNIDCTYVRRSPLRPIPAGRKGLVGALTRVVRRVLLQLFEYPDVQLLCSYRKALESEGEYDVIISFAVPYPVHWGVAWARKKHKTLAKTWVADCGDPYMGNEIDSFRKPFYFKYVEKWFSRIADYITIPVEAARSAYYPEFHHKIAVIPQGLNFDKLTQSLPGHTPHPVPTFAYAGSFIAGRRDPRKFLDYLLGLNIDFRFHVFTTMGDMIAPHVHQAPDKIIVHPYIGREELVRRLATMDFLVNFENSTNTQAPSKLIDYHLANRPVLSVAADGLSEETIGQFLAGDYSGQLRMNGYDAFRIDRVAASFLALTEKG